MDVGGLRCWLEMRVHPFHVPVMIMMPHIHSVLMVDAMLFPRVLQAAEGI
jgi:hypothetical protein